MKESNVRLGSHNYLVTFSDNVGYETYKKEKALVYGDLVNDMMHVTDVWLVPSSLDLSVNDVWISKRNESGIAAFCTSSKFIGNPLNGSGNEIECKTKSLKIWHPSTKKKQPMIVHCYSLINNIKFHWILSKNDKDTSIAPLRKICHDTYTEYDEYDVPDMDILFTSAWIDFPYPIWIDDIAMSVIRFIDEDKNEIEVKKVTRTITDQEFSLLCESSKRRCQLNEDGTYTFTKYDVPDGAIQQVSFKSLMMKWSILDVDGIQMMKYDASNMDSYAKMSKEMIVTLFPWSKIIDEFYQGNEEIESSSCSFNTDSKIFLEANVQFIDGKVSAVGKFQYNSSMQLQQYYEELYNVDLSTYKKVATSIDEDALDSELLQGHPEMCGYEVTVASDVDFKHVIWTSSSYDNTIDDFSIPLIDLFTDWNQVPSNVYLRLAFIDRYIGITMKSNVCVLTKDYIRHIITDIEEGRVRELPSLQERDEDNPYTYKQYNKNIEIMNDTNKVFFIDNIRCNILKKGSSVSSTHQRTAPRVIYKPLFYRTEDAQNIKIRRNVTQNVGINLSKYMTKVDLFYIRIDGNDFPEIARNGIYVIFKVDALSNSLESPSYDVIDNEGNYITTGNISYT